MSDCQGLLPCHRRLTARAAVRTRPSSIREGSQVFRSPAQLDSGKQEELTLLPGNHGNGRATTHPLLTRNFKAELRQRDAFRFGGDPKLVFQGGPSWCFTTGSALNLHQFTAELAAPPPHPPGANCRCFCGKIKQIQQDQRWRGLMAAAFLT